MNNNNIVCDDGPDEAAWCEDCDARLFERRDGSMICSNGDCDRQYPAGSINKHKRNLQPIENPYDTDGPILISMTEYGQKPKKKETILDKEEKRWVAAQPGRTIIDVQEWPEGDPRD